LALARPFDNTRPYTGGNASICENREFMMLNDVEGYNYHEDIALAAHKSNPQRVMIFTESKPGENDQLNTWKLVKENPWITGCFVWSACEYIGESWSGWVGLNGENAAWPSYAAACGLIDITGFPKGGQFYRRVMAGASPIEINVLEPLPEGRRYIRNPWSWPNEYPSWGWAGFEGDKLKVKVITHAPAVRLKLNGKVVGTGKTGADGIDVVFDVNYEPGELLAEGLQDGKVVCSTKLISPGKPVALRLVADRPTITTQNNDLAYVSVEVVDAAGRLVMQDRHQLRLSVEGVGALEACGTGYSKDVHSFRNPEGINTWRGRALAIIRPSGTPGAITIKARSETLGTAELKIESK